MKCPVNHPTGCHECQRCRRDFEQLVARLDRIEKIVNEKILASYAGHPAFKKRKA